MNAQRANRSARKRSGRRRRPGTAALIVLAAAVAASVLVVLGARTVVARARCASNPAVVRVAVSPEIAPAIRTLAAYFNRQHRQVSGHCVSVAVQSASGGAVAGQLRGGARAAGVDAWIPDSSLWTALVRGASAAQVRETGISVAQTPLVIVMPRAAAAHMPAFGTVVSWRFLMPHRVGGPSPALGLHIQIPDPTLSGTGLATLIQIQRLLPQGANALVGLTRFVLHSQVVAAPGGRASLAALAATAATARRRSEPVTVIPEQEAIQFDRLYPTKPLAVRYPAEGTYQLTFPYVTTTSERLTESAALAFGKLLQSPYARSYLRYEGFHTGQGPVSHWPAWYGLSSGQPRLLASMQPAQASAALRVWDKLTLGVRMLAMLDVSGAMAVPVSPGGPPLEQVLGKTAVLGLARFPDSTQLGVWDFASNLDGALPYRQIVPIGPLPGPFGLVSRRQAIARLAGKGQAVPHAPNDLYGAILDAYKHMLATYQPQYSNNLVVLTAGLDNAPGGVTASALLQDLRTLTPPGKRVVITAIMVGRAGDFRALRRIAAATGGVAADITDPQQIGAFFYQAMSQNLCRPHCSGQ